MFRPSILIAVNSAEAVTRRCCIKKMLLKILQNTQENACARVSFLIKLQAEACNFIKKETVAQVFSCEFCEIFQNTFFIEHLRWLPPTMTVISNKLKKYFIIDIYSLASIPVRFIEIIRSTLFLANWKDFKNDEKCFLFLLKSSFHSQDISIFVLIFCSCRKTAWLER